jgi:hypothetical protein
MDIGSMQMGAGMDMNMMGGGFMYWWLIKLAFIFK